MKNEIDKINTPWYVITWRLIWILPYMALALPLWLVVILMLGKHEGRDFYEEWVDIA